MNALVRARTFLLGAYHDLPNVLFMGSFLLGALTGYLPLVWVSLGLVFNGAVVAAFQGLLSYLFPRWTQVAVPANSYACDIFARMSGNAAAGGKGGVSYVAPSYWLSAAVFFAIFSIYNSIKIALKEPAAGAPKEKVDTRRAFSLTTMTIGLFFLALIFARGFTGCETWLGSTTGAVIGAAGAIGFWHLLDACGAGTIPDVLQVVNGMAPGSDGGDEVPVICSPGDAPPSSDPVPPFVPGILPQPITPMPGPVIPSGLGR